VLRYSQGSPFRHHTHTHMVTINNSEMKAAFSSATKTQVFEQPNQVDNSRVIPIVDVTPRKYKIANFVKRTTLTNASNATIYTTPADKDFYLTSAQLSIIKDVTATSIFTIITAVIGGATREILMLPGFTLTVQNQTTSIAYTIPIKLDRNTNIAISHSTNVANITGTACITGYEDEVM